VPAIAERIIELKQIVAARAQVTAERVLAELARIGFADVTQAVEIKRGMAKIKDTKNLPQDVKQAISEIRSGRDGTVVKFHDKVRALDALGKHLGLFKENIELNVNVSLADLVNGSYKLAAGEQPGVIEHQANEPDASHALPNEQGDGGEAS
jgi:hypothetical protein